ncbi:DMT family transporter [Undibacterium sp. TJN19]|uniref:DMT family transporter n=1 Tax=Undibacterium sp. TJN19 TaxID=3413055 RepID=UPI003BF29DF0
MKTPAFSSLLALHMAVFLFGAAGVLGKMLAVGALLLVFGRTLFASLSLLPVLAWQGQLNFREVPKSVILCGVLLAVHWLSFFAALNYASVAFGLMGFASFPLFVALLEPWFFKEKRRASDAWAAVAVVIGMIVMVSDASWKDGAVIGLALGIFSGLGFAFLVMANRWQGGHIPAFKLAFLQNAVATLALLPFVLAADVMTGISMQTWGGLVLLGVVFTALSHGLFMFSLRRLSTSFASLMTSLEPVYGMLLAYFFLHEMPGMREMAGAAIVLAATAHASYLHGKH